MVSTVSARVLNSNSFHPVSQVSFSLSTETLLDHCSLHLLYRFSPSLFVDPYELSEREASYKFVVWGVTELEKPVISVENSDTNALFTVAIRPWREETRNLEFEVEVPLHGRYLPPSTETAARVDAGAYRHIPLERPQAFFACPTGLNREPSTQPLAYMTPSQQAEVNMTSGATEFVQLSYLSNDPVEFVRLPIGRSEHLFSVQLTTTAVIFFTFYWVGAEIVRTARRLGSGRTETDHKKKE